MSYNRVLRTHSKWSREQKPCYRAWGVRIRAWGVRMNLVAYMCKDEVKRENVSLSITLNHNPKCNISTLCYISVKLFRKTALWRRPVTSLGHQGGRRVFWEGTKFFKLCPIILNYVQHIFTSGAENFLGGASRPWLRACCDAWRGASHQSTNKTMSGVLLCFFLQLTSLMILCIILWKNV